MFNITKEEIEMDDKLLGRINNICSLNNTTAKIINGCIRNISNTNISYIEPHRVLINNNLYLFFNDSEEVFINDLNNKIRLVELENYIKAN